jgi:hypothetical protein
LNGGAAPLAAVFENCPMLAPPDYATPHSPAALLAAHKLEYWTPRTHRLCQLARREWVRCVLLVLGRVELPVILCAKVLGMLKRHELGR